MSTAGLTQYLMENPLYAMGGAIGQEGTRTTPVRTGWEGLARALQGGIAGLSQGYAMQNAKDEQTLDQKTLADAMTMYRTDQPGAMKLLASRPRLADTTNALLMSDVGFQKQVDLLKYKNQQDEDRRKKLLDYYGLSGDSGATGAGFPTPPAKDANGNYPSASGVNPNNVGAVRPVGASTGFQAPASFDDGVALAVKNVRAYPGAYNGGRPMSLQQIAEHWAPKGDGANDPPQWARNVGAHGGLDPAAPLDFSDPRTAAAFARGVHGAEHGAKAVRPMPDYMPGVASALQLGPRQPAQPQLAQLPPGGAPGGPSAMPTLSAADLAPPGPAPNMGAVPSGPPPAPMPQPAGGAPPGPPPAPMPAPAGVSPPGPPPAPMPVPPGATRPAMAPPAPMPGAPQPMPAAPRAGGQETITIRGVPVPKAEIYSALAINDPDAQAKRLSEIVSAAAKEQRDGPAGQFVRDASGREQWISNAQLGGMQRYDKPPDPGTKAGDVHILHNADRNTAEWKAAYARQAAPTMGTGGQTLFPDMSAFGPPPEGAAGAPRVVESPSGQFGMAEKLADDFNSNQAVKSYRTVAPILNSLRASMTDDSKVGDLDFVYGVSKLMDPESVVRESEGQMIIKTQMLPEQIRGYVNGVIGGGQLQPAARQKLLELAERRVSALQSQHDAVVSDYTDKAKRYGLNPQDVIINKAPGASEHVPKAPGAGGAKGAPIQIDHMGKPL